MGFPRLPEEERAARARAAAPLFEYLREQGLSRNWLARELGVRHARVDQIRSGDCILTPRLARKIAKLLGVGYRRLFGHARLSEYKFGFGALVASADLEDLEDAGDTLAGECATGQEAESLPASGQRLEEGLRARGDQAGGRASGREAQEPVEELEMVSLAS
jgi:transcriptional regulator with XRE-family HTH domain